MNICLYYKPSAHYKRLKHKIPIADQQTNRSGQGTSHGVSQSHPRHPLANSIRQNIGTFVYPISVNAARSEQELATISAAITAHEISSEEQRTAIAAATIYPDSSLPSYNQGEQKLALAYVIVFYMQCNSFLNQFNITPFSRIKCTKDFKL